MRSLNIPMSKPPKMSRAQIKEGIKQIPIERIVQGANSPGEKRATAKQRQFIELVANGKKYAEAYREVYSPNAKPATAATEGSRLAKIPHVATMIEARMAEIESEKSQTPAHIRAHTIRELFKNSTSDKMPPAQRVKCLELLGKITEVALFTERREVVQVTNAGDARARLLAALRAAMAKDAITVDDNSGDSLIAEIKTAPAIDAPDAETLPTPDPLESARDTDAILHSIPHTQSAVISEPTPYQNGSPPDWEDISTSQTGNWVDEPHIPDAQNTDKWSKNDQ